MLDHMIYGCMLDCIVFFPAYRMNKNSHRDANPLSIKADYGLFIDCTITSGGGGGGAGPPITEGGGGGGGERGEGRGGGE